MSEPIVAGVSRHAATGRVHRLELSWESVEAIPDRNSGHSVVRTTCGQSIEVGEGLSLPEWLKFVEYWRQGVNQGMRACAKCAKQARPIRPIRFR